jgi:hypothetical protein
MTLVQNQVYTYQSVLFLVLELLNEYERHKRPSPTIRQLASTLGHTEEIILESLEFGRIEPVSLLQ